MSQWMPYAMQQGLVGSPFGVSEQESTGQGLGGIGSTAASVYGSMKGG
jgi:hypothetical protein